MVNMYSIVINPTSGKGAALKKLEKLEELLQKRSIAYRVDRTEKSGDAQKLATKAVIDGLTGVIAVGGDGTFSEVVHGVKESGLEVILAPNGTGNDFVRMFKLPKDTVAAVEKQLDSPTRYIDIAKCNDRYFLNVIGCGFDVEVLRVVEQIKDRTSALGAYLTGAYSAIKNYRPMDVTLAKDDGSEETHAATVVSVGNGTFIGGGMKAIPGACVDDGLLDVMTIGTVKRWAIYGLLLLFAAGLHVWLKKLVKIERCRKVHINSNDLYLQADGEIFRADDVVLSVVPGALKTRLPV